MNRNELAQEFTARFNLDELKSLVWELGWDYENFPNTKRLFIIDMINYAEAIGEMECLLAHAKATRPNFNV